jgi:hypothetical protein
LTALDKMELQNNVTRDYKEQRDREREKLKEQVEKTQMEQVERACDKTGGENKWNKWREHVIKQVEKPQMEQVERACDKKGGETTNGTSGKNK